MCAWSGNIIFFHQHVPRSTRNELSWWNNHGLGAAAGYGNDENGQGEGEYSEGWMHLGRVERANVPRQAAVKARRRWEAVKRDSSGDDEEVRNGGSDGAIHKIVMRACFCKKDAKSKFRLLCLDSSETQGDF